MSGTAQSPRSLGKVLLCAGPLLCLGTLWTVLWDPPGMDASHASLKRGAGAFYVLAGSLLFTPWRGAPKLAIVAWVPFLIAIPIGTVVALFAFRGLLTWNPPLQAPVHQPSLSRFGVVELVTRLFVTEYGNYHSPAGKALSVKHDLMISPGAFGQFLDNLRIDHRFSVSADDAATVDTLDELLDLILSRHFPDGALHPK